MGGSAQLGWLRAGGLGPSPVERNSSEVSSLGVAPNSKDNSETSPSDLFLQLPAKWE